MLPVMQYGNSVHIWLQATRFETATHLPCSQPRAVQRLCGESDSSIPQCISITTHSSSLKSFPASDAAARERVGSFMQLCHRPAFFAIRRSNAGFSCCDTAGLVASFLLRTPPASSASVDQQAATAKNDKPL